MYANAGCHEGTDGVRSEETTRKAGESRLPLRKLPGFSGCYVFEAAEDVFTSTCVPTETEELAR